MARSGSGRRSARRGRPHKDSAGGLPKAPSGIRGFDEITGGGLPRGRPTLVCGGAGCGKTLFALEFLVRGAVDHGEPGVFVSFEETEAEIAVNAASLGFDVARLVAQKKLFVDWVRVERSEIEETGEYDLEGLFVRLQHAVDEVGAKRVALDTIESLFSAIPNEAVIRSELRRLFRWLKERGLTAVVTGEKGDGTLTRHGLEEYVSDCVISLDHRVKEQVSTRRLRVVKYRGSPHGTNEYPFLVDARGISVLPITSIGMNHPASRERITSGVARLDEMLGGKGYFRGSTVLVSGTGHRAARDDRLRRGERDPLGRRPLPAAPGAERVHAPRGRAEGHGGGLRRVPHQAVGSGGARRPARVRAARPWPEFTVCAR